MRPTTSEITRTALQIVASFSRETTQRMADLEPRDIVLALSPEAADRWDWDSLERLQHEISRLCRLQVEAAA